MPRPARGGPGEPRQAPAGAPGHDVPARSTGRGRGRSASGPADAGDAAGATEPPGAAGPAAVYRTGPGRPASPMLTVLRRLRWLRRMPGPRLTGLGCGLLAVVLMVVAGTLNGLLAGASPDAYGVTFLVASVICALWVRPAELSAAPVAMPIAFFLGLVPMGDRGPLTDRLVELVTALATNALWLYAGTLLAVATVLLRKVVLLAARAARRAAERPHPADPAPDGPGPSVP
ncbi:hypothetical protein HCK00_07945 [Streptomyces sp. PLAI1-29]|uniref:DUF6542 domain-containing protein n=1 Tax=Streptomyces zingiberis TaxID=2053010 RepID=A0ABX1BVA5_9ACTN|nr:hypothetical protein [Streptomyces zingiberis]